MADFEAALDHVLHWEGGYVNDAADSGGRTNYGIAEASHPEAWEDGPPTEGEAIAIYREKYWSHERVRAGQIEDDRIALYLFDCAVNHGPKKAATLLQRAIIRCGAGISADGWVGPKTRGALREFDPEVVLDRFVLVRVEFYRAIVESDGSQKKFLFGWLNRALDVVEV